MKTLYAGMSIALVLAACVAGVAGTGLIYTALVHGEAGALDGGYH
jgi:hypothetical protein